MLGASEAYVRRLLVSGRLYGIKVGPVWGIYREDLEDFLRVRRPPGRPPKAAVRPPGEADTRLRIERDKVSAQTTYSLRRPRAPDL